MTKDQLAKVVQEYDSLAADTSSPMLSIYWLLKAILIIEAYQVGIT